MKTIYLTILFTLGAIIMTQNTGAASAPIVDHLGDLQHLLESKEQGWGTLGINVAAYGWKQEPVPLRIGDKTYERGLGHHAPGQIVIDLDGAYSLFEAEVGVQNQPSGAGSVEFIIYVDEREAFRSGVMQSDSAAKSVRVDVQGADELRLVATDAGDGIICDLADWADARLTRSASPKVRSEAEVVDLAPFGRICTWDPNRTDGCRASRVEEFRQEDLFTETELVPDASGEYTIPASGNDPGCIGLQWLEMRRLRSLTIDFANPPQSLDGARVECWKGESTWQGQWEPLIGDLSADGNRWMFAIDRKQSVTAATGTRKVRWIIPNSASARVRRLGACSQSRYCSTDLYLSVESAGGGRGRVSVYNGVIVDSLPALSSGEWDLSKPTLLSIRYTKPSRCRFDRTVLRFELPSGAFGVAVDDVLAAGSVQVRGSGLVVSAKPSGAEPAKGRTVLERVREMPDQTFAQALEKTRNPIQSNGPMILSLACDNRKFIVERNGVLAFETDAEPGGALPVYPLKRRPCLMQPRFGSGKNEGLERKLEVSYLPIIANSVHEDGVEYRQVTYVAPLDDERPTDAPDWVAEHTLCISEFTVRNTGPKPANVSLALAFVADTESNTAADLSVENGRIAVTKQADFLAAVDTSEASPLVCSSENGEARFTGTIPAYASAACRVYIPAWNATEAQQAKLTGRIDLREQLAAYWRRVFAPAMKIDIPDDDLQAVMHMQRIHCLMAARSEDGGKLVAPWIGALSYGPLESEAHSIVRGMDMLGHSEFAQRSLDFFISKYNDAGFLTTGYTLMGTGWHLWTLGEHYELTHDSQWLSRVAPEVARVCHWIDEQRAKTKSGPENAPERGLMPPGVQADWNAFSYHFSLNGYFDAGLAHAGAALADIGYPDGKAIAESASEFRENILRAYRRAQSQMPVYPLKDGTWVPGYPGQLHAPGQTNDFFPGQDGNRSWCYDVELGAHQLVPAGVLDPASPDVEWMMEHMEDAQFLHSGMGDYPAEKNEADWFNQGGFAKVQPFYCRNAEIYAMRDEVKPFIRSYFNAMASLLNTETLWFWEHFHNIAAWDKTHETGYWLQQTRWTFVIEHGDELWLAPFVTTNWLKDGMRISIGSAPTRFGKVSYSISSHVGQGYMEAVVEPPTRTPPREIVIRLRHPDGKKIKSATIEGAELLGIDPEREIVRVKPGSGRFVVRAEF